MPYFRQLVKMTIRNLLVSISMDTIGSVKVLQCISTFVLGSVYMDDSSFERSQYFVSVIVYFSYNIKWLVDYFSCPIKQLFY